VKCSCPDILTRIILLLRLLILELIIFSKSMLEVFFSLTCVRCLHSFKCERIPCIQKPKLRTCWRSFVFFATNPIIDFVGCIIWQIQSAYFKWDLCLTLVVKLIKLNSFCATCQCGWLTPHCRIWYITHMLFIPCVNLRLTPLLMLPTLHCLFVKMFEISPHIEYVWPIPISPLRPRKYWYYWDEIIVVWYCWLRYQNTT